MTVTQDELINDIAAKEDVDVMTVRKVFKSAETIIFAHLSSAAPTEKITIKLLRGLSVVSEHIPERTIDRGLFQGYTCPGKIRTKATVTDYYKRKLNEHRE